MPDDRNLSATGPDSTIYNQSAGCLDLSRGPADIVKINLWDVQLDHATGPAGLAAERTVEGMWDAIGRVIETFASQECRNYFNAAGYDPA